MNGVPTPILNDQSPYGCLFGCKLDFTDLKVFGCLAYASILTAGRHKFYTRSRKCAFLGYKIGVKRVCSSWFAYQRTFGSRNVTFSKMIYLIVHIILMMPCILTTCHYLTFPLHLTAWISFLKLLQHQNQHLSLHHLTAPTQTCLMLLLLWHQFLLDNPFDPRKPPLLFGRLST